MTWASLAALRWRERPSARRCGLCRHFRNDPQFLEASVPGLASLSSGAASVRADDGLCALRDLYLSARAGCGQFSAAELDASAQAPVVAP